MWEIVLAMAILGILAGAFLVGTDYYQYLDLQRRLRKEREAKERVT